MENAPNTPPKGAVQLSDAAIKQGTWLTTPLWNEYEWGDILEGYGVTWQDFMGEYRWVQRDFIRWGRGQQPWSTAIETFIDHLATEFDS